MKHRDCTVAATNWNSGYSCCDGVVTMTPFKGFAPSGKIRKGECYGRRVESHEEANRLALERGYSQVYFNRPFAFISLSLPRRTRAWLRAKPKTEWLAALRALLETVRDHDYLKAVFEKDYMVETRNRWLRYIETPGRRQ